MKFYEDNTWGWLIHRFERLAIPYLIWSVVYLGIDFFLHGGKSIFYYIKALTFGLAAVPFYFIVVLLLFTLLTPLLVKCLENSFCSWGVLLITPILQILGYIFLNLGIDVWGKLRYLPIWIAFYYGGMLIRRYHFNFSRQWVCYGVLISFWGEVAETLYLLSSKYMAVAAFSQLRFTGFIYAAFLCLLFVSLKKDNEKTVYHICFEGLYDLGVSIGNHSFNIFFLHMFFILLCERIIPTTFSLPLVHFIELSCCLLGTYGITICASKLLKDKCSYLGLFYR